jgi:hypothetical protein
MNRLTRSRKLVLTIMAVALLAAALPGVALAADDLVRFRVVNNSERSITIRLYSQDGSGKAYYMVVPGEATKDMSPLRGTYDYRLTACGIMVRGTVDLSKPLRWQVPDCGDKGGPGSKAPNTQDVGKILKLTKVKLTNKTGTDLKVWLDGPFQYVFNIPSGASKSVSIPAGTYEWGHFACDGDRTDGFLEVAGATKKVFECK